jgi:hypothetical protein
MTAPIATKGSRAIKKGTVSLIARITIKFKKKTRTQTDRQTNKHRYLQLFPGIGAPAPPVDALPVAAAAAAAAAAAELASSAIRIISIRIVCCSTVSAVVAA